MGTLIRAVTPSDMPDVLALLRLEAEFDGCPEALVATPERLASAWFADPPLASALLAVHDGRAVGLATYHATFSTYLARPGLWLDDLFVAEGHRGQGIGKALLARLAEIAEERGCGRVEWVVAAVNARGIAFYEREGAIVSSRVRPVRLDRAAIERLARRTED